MSNTKSANQHPVDEFFRGLSGREVPIASAVLTKKTVDHPTRYGWRNRS
jgi:hypothetical protein